MYEGYDCTHYHSRILRDESQVMTDPEMWAATHIFWETVWSPRNSCNISVVELVVWAVASSCWNRI